MYVLSAIFTYLFTVSPISTTVVVDIIIILMRAWGFLCVGSGFSQVFLVTCLKGRWIGERYQSNTCFDNVLIIAFIILSQ